MQMRQFTPRQTLAGIRVTPQEWKPDPNLSLKQVDLYASAWECEYEQPIFDTGNNNATLPISSEIPVQSDLSTEEIKSAPGRAQNCSPENFLQTEESCDVTDTYPHMELDVETSSEQLNNNPTNPCSSKYKLGHKPKLNCNDDYSY